MRIALATTLAVSCALGGPPQANKKAATATGPTTRSAEPAQPFIQFAFPPGGRQGTTVQSTAYGQNLQDAREVRISGDGLKARIVEAADPSKVTLSIEVAADAQPGEREVRLLTPGGVSNRFRFIVGQLTEVLEKEPNSDRLREAQVLGTLPLTVNGQVMEGDRDCFRFNAKAGQTLVFAVQARALIPFIADAVPGWNDVCLTLYDDAGRQLSSVDDFRFDPDPVLIYRVPRDGDYIIEVSDILFRGRGDFVYRLSMGELPYLTHIFPLGGPMRASSTVHLFGVNLPASTQNVPAAPDATTIRYVQVARGGILSNVLPFAASDLPEVMEHEPNDTRATPQQVDLPAVINGRIDHPGDADYFAFDARADQKVAIEVYGRRLRSPVDAIITIYGVNGARLAENDDAVDAGEPMITHHADSLLNFIAPATGRFVVRVRDVQGKGGLEYAYRLSVGEPRPDFALRVSPDNPRVSKADSAVLAVTAIRRNAFPGEITLSVRGLPSGFVASPAVLGPKQEQVLLTSAAPVGAQVATFSPTVIGTANLNGAPVTRTAVPAEAVMQAFAYTHHVPAREMLLSVVEFDTFALEFESAPRAPIELKPGGSVELVVIAKRKDGIKGGIALKPAAVTPGITVRAAFIPADSDRATVSIVSTKKATPAAYSNIVLTGSLKIGKDTIIRSLPAIPVVTATRIVGVDP
jgi:hypothetical protein